MLKSYQVYYIIKKNNREYLEHIFINANNTKAACQECKRIVREKTGRNAFYPTTKEPKQINEKDCIINGKIYKGIL